MFQTTALPAIIVLIAGLLAAITDVWKFKVYNVITVPLVVSGLGYYAVVGGLSPFLGSVYGLLFGFGILIIPYLMGAVGAGDVKFLAGIGCWLGLPNTLVVVVVGCLASGMYGIVSMVYHGRVSETWLNLQIMWFRLLAVGQYLRASEECESVQTIARRPDRRRHLIPFSAMITVGVVANLAWHTWAG